MNRHPRCGIQKLRTMREAQSGRVLGILACSVHVALGQGAALAVEDVVEGIIVGQVLNPFEGVFLADEVQRAMRLGLARWLCIEIDAQHAMAVEKLAGADGWRVLFELHMPDGQEDFLSVDVSACAAGQAVNLAVTEVAYWCARQSARPLPPDIVDTLLDADLDKAPWLRAGLAFTRSFPLAAAGREAPDQDKRTANWRCERSGYFGAFPF